MWCRILVALAGLVSIISGQFTAGVFPGGDLVCGPTAPSNPADRANRTLYLGYTHPIYLKASTKALVQVFFNSEAEASDWCIQTGPTGVLDPREMWRWPSERVPHVFEVYTMVVGKLWKTGQIACLNDLYSGWQISHGFALQDDLRWSVGYELRIDNCWVAVPRSHEARSIRINVTRWNECGVGLPPPLNGSSFAPPYFQSYRWPDLRDQLVGLARCGVKKPLILEECMSHPWFMSILHNYQIYLYNTDGTSGWRNPTFVDVIYTILWPILKEAAITDPDQSMVKQWINWNSPIMQEYAATPLADWPATKPTPLPRSECVIATSVEGSSSHYQGNRPEIQLVESPGSANSFQSWTWAKSGRPMNPEVNEMANRWLSFIANYLNPNPTLLFQTDLTASRIPVYTRARNRPEFQAKLQASVSAQIGDRLIDKGHTINYPGAPTMYTDLFEGYAVVSRFLADLMFKSGLNPSNWNDATTVKAAIRMAALRGAELLELLNLKECSVETDTISKLNGTGSTVTVRIFDPAKINRTCLDSDYARAALAASPLLYEVVGCQHPADTLYVLDAVCDGSTATATAIWDPLRVNFTCRLTNASTVSLQAAADRSVSIDCSYIAPSSGTGTAFLVLGLLQQVYLVVLMGCVMYKRRQAAIRASSWQWSIGVLLACAFVGWIVFIEVGPRTNQSCSGSSVVGPLGLTALFAILLVKLRRVHTIYNQKHLHVTRISDCQLFGQFCICFSVSLVMVIIWAFVLKGDYTKQAPLILEISRRGLTYTECNYGPVEFWIIWGLYLGALVTTSLFYVMGLRKMQDTDQFSEPTSLFWATLTVPILFLIIIVAFITSTNEAVLSLWKVILALFFPSLMATIYTVPKVVHATSNRSSNQTTLSGPRHNSKATTPSPHKPNQIQVLTHNGSSGQTKLPAETNSDKVGQSGGRLFSAGRRFSEEPQVT